jgi:GDP-L-fucose synthase
MKILLTGARGFLGGYVFESLVNKGHRDILTPTREQYDLTNADHVGSLFKRYEPDYVVHLAADVGGIGANMNNPGRFFYNNISMGINLVENARIYGVKHFTFVGTVCSYPKFCFSPFREESIWSGYPEETNAPYGIAKKSIITMLQAYKAQYGLNSCCLIPTNLYGPRDHFDESKSHVIPALIKKFVDAKNNKLESVECWGTGSATREFLYVEDAAEAIVQAIGKIDDPSPINLGSGFEISIRDLVQKIRLEVGYDGDVLWDTSKPDGQPKRFLDTSRAKELIGWEASTGFDEGIRNTIRWYNVLNS